MNDVPGVSYDQRVDGPCSVHDKWLSFELRMRRRRLARCLQQAERAIEDGVIEEARSALNEALQLDPACADRAAFEQRLRALQDRGQPAAVRVIPACRLPVARVSAAFVSMFAASAVLGTGYWYAASPSRGSKPSSTASAIDTDAVANAGVSAAPPLVDRLEIVRETVTAPVATPRIVEDRPSLPAKTLTANNTPDPLQVIAALNRQPAAPPVSIPKTSAELRWESMPPPSPPNSVVPAEVVEPSAARAEGLFARVESDGGSGKEAATATGASAGHDESSVVLGVLQQYELAYSSLDAEAAAAVWPSVNRNALARAFNGLASQHVSLGRCDVAVDGPAARATCSGSATWEPKVGGGRRTEPRHWDFELRKTGGGWRIERAVAGQ
jgi:hypothetical protein